MIFGRIVRAAYSWWSDAASAGTTTSLVFGSHFAAAVDALFAEAERYGLRVTSGLVVSDRILPEPLLTTPERAYDELLGSADGAVLLRSFLVAASSVRA